MHDMPQKLTLMESYLVRPITYMYIHVYNTCFNSNPANTRHPPNTGPMLVHRLRRWPITGPILGGCIMFAGIITWLVSARILGFSLGVPILQSSVILFRLSVETTKCASQDAGFPLNSKIPPSNQVAYAPFFKLLPVRHD